MLAVKLIYKEAYNFFDCFPTALHPQNKTFFLKAFDMLPLINISLMIRDSSHGSSWFIYHKYSKSHQGIHENRNARGKSVEIFWTV